MTSETNDESAPLNRRGLIPVWAPLLVMLAVVLTGIVLGGIGTSYTVLFAVSAIVCTALVELRGLFLTVVLLPVYWFFGVTAAGLVGGASATANSSFKATLITVAYPAIEKFLWLAATFVICVVIAVVRQRIDATVLQNQHRRELSRRRHLSDAEQNNQRLNARVRDIDRTSDTERPVRTNRADRPIRTERPDRPERDQSTTRAYRSSSAAPSSPAAEERRTEDTPRYRRARETDRRPAPEVRPSAAESAGAPENPENRTRTAAELREASRRRRTRSQDRPLDMD